MNVMKIMVNKTLYQIGWQALACFDDHVNFSFADSFDLQEILRGRVCNRFKSAEIRISELLDINGSNARRLLVLLVLHC
ncbi:hypothetical protein CJ030_MR6G001928 [Morella rubra]|uniref:Uncharacterized protein n=1 Tax=Morella rubra TaxID=262757 RepID=A0A6A1VA76_9ROSI|nr:hypothetical protein CJ030_MR6G001928 [Morella rubra]